MKRERTRWSLGLLLIVIGLSCPIIGGASERGVHRISSSVLDVGKVHEVYMVYGMATTITLPNAIGGIIPGNKTSLVIERKTPENLLTIWLKGRHVAPTNLIILSGKTQIVFDLVPNSKIHQDSLEVAGTYGGPEMSDDNARLIYSGKL